MTDPYFNLQNLRSDFQTAYDAVMQGSGLSSDGRAQKNAIAFGQKVKQTSPSDYLKTSIPDEDRYHNRFSDSRFRVEALEKSPSSTPESSDGAASSDAAGKFFIASPLKKMLNTILDSEELYLDEPFEVSVKQKMVHKAGCGSESEIKTAQVWSMAVEEGSHSVNNSHQYSNIRTSPIIQADNMGNEHVLTPQEQTADNKDSGLEYKRELRKDPVYAERERERERERKRKLRKNPAYIQRERERQRERRKNPAYAERDRVRKRERYQNDPVYAEGQKIFAKTYRKMKKQFSKEEASKLASVARKEYIQSVNLLEGSGDLPQTSSPAETTQNSNKNLDVLLPFSN